MTQTDRPDYGIDAPYVIRNLAIAGGITLLVGFAALAGILPRDVVWHPAPSMALHFPLVSMGLLPGVALTGMACWMYFGGRYGKIAERDKILNRIDWRGDEWVLDIGCGRGLVLVGAARRLKTGRAIGIDVWHEADLSGNRPEVPMRNAALEGVGDRVAVETADMRKLPFADGSFDVVASRAAIHNLTSAADRAQAVREIARVLRPGGRAVIADIRNLHQYARVFAETGCPDVQLLDSRVVSALIALVTMGTLRPNTMLVRKSSDGTVISA